MAQSEPAWSIVIPTYGRGAQLPGLLEALSRQVAPAGGFEVIIVDDGSPQPLDEIVEPFRERLPLILHRQTNAGPASARNTGVALARGRWIALTDDDCRPGARWLVELARGLDARNDVLIGGMTINGYPHMAGAAASQTLVDYLYASAQKAGAGALDFVTSNNMALSRHAFERLGGFDTDFPLAAGEDRDFCDRWIASGGTIEQAPAAHIEHFHALTPRAFWRQHFNYGRGAHRVHALRQARRTSAEQRRFKRLSFYGGLIFYPVRERRPQALRQTAMLTLSQLATTAGYLAERFTQSDHA